MGFKFRLQEKLQDESQIFQCLPWQSPQKQAVPSNELQFRRIYLQLPERSYSLKRAGMCPGESFFFFNSSALKNMNPIWPKSFARIQQGRSFFFFFFAVMWWFGFNAAMEQKPLSWEVSLRARPPASRTCPLFGSCPGRRRRAVCSGGDPCPTGQTGAVHSGNFGCFLLWGNPATRDGQTHSLQHTERKKVHNVVQRFWFYFSFFGGGEGFKVSLMMYRSRRLRSGFP